MSELAIGLLDSVRCFKNLVNICYFPSKHEQAHLKFVHHYLALSETTNSIVFIAIKDTFLNPKLGWKIVGLVICRQQLHGIY